MGEGVSFASDIQPIFDAKCAVCHPTSFSSTWTCVPITSYDELVRVSSALQAAFERVLPRRPELSYLLRHVPDPSRENLLTAGEKKLIERWILEARRNSSRIPLHRIHDAPLPARACTAPTGPPRPSRGRSRLRRTCSRR